MLFNSFEFFLLLAPVFLLYYLPLQGPFRRLWQVGVLLVASCIFYAWDGPTLLILLGSSCLFNTYAAERILYWKRQDIHATEKYQPAKVWLVVAVVLNLLFLAFFKYSGIILGLFSSEIVSPDVVKWAHSIPLPIGISFYTFHALSLIIDIYRDKVSDETKQRLEKQGIKGRGAALTDLSLYIIFFPQLVAGPIVKARNFIDQIREKWWGDIPWVVVRRCLILGYFLKVFVADNLAEQTARLTISPEVLETTSAVDLMALLYGYSIQIFSDFAGYSLIAIGLGLMFGYQLPTNFNFPYISTSITDFWRRWHISLSSWLRDYLYFPLGGNKKGAGRTYLNLIIVMFLGGLWHGAEWKFVWWGVLHGLFLAAERLVSQMWTPAADVSPPRKTEHVKKILGWIYTFHVVTFLWLTFLMPDMKHLLAFFKGLTNGSLTVSGPPIFSLLFYGSAVIFYHLWGLLNEQKPAFFLKSSIFKGEPILHALMIFLIFTNPGAPRGFIYFQF